MRRRTHARRPGLLYDHLETRRLLAIRPPTIPFDGNLIITGDRQDDHVVVTREGSKIVVTDRAPGGFVLTEPRFLFDRSRVSTVVFEGNDGDDFFDNDSGIPTRAYGGDDNDTLYGTSADDELHGNDGNDELHGSGGNDSLYGGADNDALFGGSGNDGLYGGGSTSPDTLTGGTGADRLLVQSTDRILDEASEDAKITFVNGPKRTRKIAGKDVTFQKGSWLNDEIELIDAALATLHARTRNTGLLETATGQSYVFTRLGKASATYSGFNDGGGKISFAARTFQRGDDWTKGTVWHELGHSWQDTRAGSYWSDWIKLSTWKKGTAASRGRKLSTDKAWTYKSTATFHRDYARTNPNEDWATTWEIALVPGSASGSPIRSKIELINRFLDSLRT